MEQLLIQYIQKALVKLYAIENAKVVLEPTKSDFSIGFWRVKGINLVDKAYAV
jgi:hypothetical protein